MKMESVGIEILCLILRSIESTPLVLVYESDEHVHSQVEGSNAPSGWLSFYSKKGQVIIN